MSALVYKRNMCEVCGRVMRFEKARPNHLLHLALSLITGGLWLIVWLLLILFSGKWMCSSCGSRP